MLKFAIHSFFQITNSNRLDLSNQVPEPQESEKLQVVKILVLLFPIQTRRFCELQINDL